MRTMQRTLFTAMALLLFLGSTSVVGQDETKDKGMERLAGIWKADLEKTKELHGEDAKEGMLEEIAKVVFSFTAEGKMQMQEGANTLNANCKLTAVEGEENAYNVEFSGGDAPSPMEGALEFVDDDTIQLAPEGQPAAVFVRVTEVSDEVKEKLYGVWNGDAEATLENAKDMELPDQVKDMIKSQVSKMGLEFGEDGNYLLKMEGNDDQPGTWKMENGPEDDAYVLTANAESGQTLKFVVRFHDGSGLSMESNPREAPAFFKKSDD